MHLQCDILLLVVCCTEELYVGDLCDNIGLVLVYLPSGALGYPIQAFIFNPRRAYPARVTVLGLCVCVCLLALI